MNKRNSASLSVIGKVNLYKTKRLPIITYARQCGYAETTSLRKLEVFASHHHRRGPYVNKSPTPITVLTITAPQLMMLSKTMVVVILTALFSSLLLMSQTAFTLRAYAHELGSLSRNPEPEKNSAFDAGHQLLQIGLQLR